MAELQVALPPGEHTARRYAAEVVFTDRLGLAVDCRHVGGVVDATVVTMPGQSGQLRLADDFFPRVAVSGPVPTSLPALPLPIWRTAGAIAHDRLVTPDVPVLYGRPTRSGGWLTRSDRTIDLGVDVLGSVFFLLSRWEERVEDARDQHGRFAAQTSIATRANIIERPLADEYVELLWACLNELWPGLRRRRRAYSFLPSHDVDWPYGLSRQWIRVARALASDLRHRRSPLTAARRLTARLAGGERRERLDPDNTFAFIMAESERHGLTSTFYFKAGCTHARFDEDYPLDAPPVRRLLTQMHRRGHRVGLHPSYESATDGRLIARELARLKTAARAADVVQNDWGSRQHYLRFETARLWRECAEAGIADDGSLAFADRVGFRCGTCISYPVFDLLERRPLPLREQPLIAMEVSLFVYAGLNATEAIEALLRLAAACRRVDGAMTLLWHNTSLVLASQREVYRAVVTRLAP